MYNYKKQAMGVKSDFLINFELLYNVYLSTRIKPCFVEQYCRNSGKRREVLRHKCQNYNPVLLRVAAKSDELKLNYLVRFIKVCYISKHGMKL